MDTNVSNFACNVTKNTIILSWLTWKQITFEFKSKLSHLYSVYVYIYRQSRYRNSFSSAGGKILSIFAELKSCSFENVYLRCHSMTMESASSWNALESNWTSWQIFCFCQKKKNKQRRQNRWANSRLSLRLTRLVGDARVRCIDFIVWDILFCASRLFHAYLPKQKTNTSDESLHLPKRKAFFQSFINFLQFWPVVPSYYIFALEAIAGSVELCLKNVWMYEYIGNILCRIAEINFVEENNSILLSAYAWI